MRRHLSPIQTRTRPSRSWPWHGKRPSIYSQRPKRETSKWVPQVSIFETWDLPHINHEFEEKMHSDSPTRRAILKSLTLTAAAGSVLRAIPLQAAEYAHHLIEDERSTGPDYAPKFFDPHQYKTLQALCDTIIPADGDSGGATEAGAPEFIDLLTSENSDYQKTLGDGLKWLDANCTKRYGK